MFVMSVKTNKKRIMGIAAGIILLVIAGIVVVLPKDTAAQTATKKGREINYMAKDNTERVSFLKQFGWDTSEEPTEIKEVVIPADFNEVYQKYNAIQLKQNLDLLKLKTKRVKRYTYEVKNYPGVTTGVRANLLVYEDKIVGGDISTVELDGFMHGFEM